MDARDDWWTPQLIENMKEASTLHPRFKEAMVPDVDELDKAIALYEDHCNAYQFTNITLKNSQNFGRACVRGRLSQINNKADDYE